MCHKNNSLLLKKIEKKNSLYKYDKQYIQRQICVFKHHFLKYIV